MVATLAATIGRTRPPTTIGGRCGRICPRLAAYYNERCNMSPAAALILEMQIYPIIRNTVHRKAKPIGSEDYQELVQDTTATAAAMIDSMEKFQAALPITASSGLSPADAPTAIAAPT